MCRKLLISLAVLSLGLLNSVRAETVLFHVKTALDKDDAQICAAPNVALAFRELGDSVILLFDASAVTSLTQGRGKMNWGNRTPMEKAALPERERQSLSEQLNIPIEKIPRNYGDYLDFLKQRGAKIYVNTTMLTLYKIDLKTVDAVAEPADLHTMIRLFKEADRIVVY